MRGLTRLLSICALVWGTGYVAWRIVSTGEGAASSAWIVLLGGEILGFVVFAVRVWQAWPPSLGGPEVGSVPDITVVVDATYAPMADVRTTLVAARAMRCRPEVLVVDETGDRWLRTVAGRVGATVMDRWADVTTAVASASCDWVLLLEPGEEPSADLAERVAESCQERVAVVQLAVGDAGASGLDTGPVSPPLVDPFDQNVIRPNLGQRRVLPWLGDTPAIVHKDTWVDEIGRGDVESRIEAMDRRWRAGTRLLGSGCRITAVAGPSVGRPDRSTVGERLDLRREMTVRRGRSLRELASTVELGPGPRMAHLATVLTPGLGALGRSLQAAALVLVLGVAQQPLATGWWDLSMMAGPAYLLRWVALLLLGRGHLSPLSSLRRELHTLGADLGSLLPDRLAHALRGHRVLVALELMVLASVADRVVAVWAGRGGLPVGTLTAALLVAVATIGVVTGVVVESFIHRQRRAHRRVRLGMVTCRLEEHEGFLVDLSSAGVGVVLPDAHQITPDSGSVTTLSFRVPGPDGQWTAVSSLVRVVRCTPDPEGGVQVGVEFDDPTAAPLDAVAEFLTSGSSWPAIRKKVHEVSE